MKQGDLVSKNLWRKPLRTILLIVSIAIAFLLFGVLGSFREGFVNPDTGNATRLITLNKINLTQPLPYSYYARIQRVEGVTDATFQNWFGGYFREPTNLLQTFSVEPVSWTRIYRENFEMPDAQWQAFQDDRTGIIISRTFAEANGIAVGQQIPLRSNIYTNRTTGQQSWNFNVVGLFESSAGNPSSAYFNYEYFRESATFGGDNIGMIVLTTRSVEENEAVANRIDAMFENSPAETSTQDEAAFFRAFLAQMGDISFIIMLVVGAAFAAILMVVGNTMVMAIRERTKEIGVMKTLGFSSERVLAMVLSESMLLSLIGAGIGLVLAIGFMFLAVMGAGNWDGSFPMPLYILFGGMGLALLFGLVTGIAPAIGAFNLKIVDALSRK